MVGSKSNFRPRFRSLTNRQMSDSGLSIECGNKLNENMFKGEFYNVEISKKKTDD